MNVKQLLKDWYQLPVKKIDTIKKQMADCKVCDTTGKLEEPKHIFDFPQMCSCTELNNKTIAHYREDCKRVKRAIDFLETQIPKEFRNHLVINQEEIDFLKSNKKILWIYNREKGAGKTTRAYSLMVLSKVFVGFNARVQKESRIYFNEFKQLYELDFQHQELIVIDDVGTVLDKKGLLADFYYKFFDDIRYIDCKVIFTSQYSISEWIARINDLEQSERIADRFKGISLEKQIGIRE